MRTRSSILLYIVLDGIAIVASWLSAIYVRYGELAELPPHIGINLYPLYLSAASVITISALSGLGAYKMRYHAIAPVVKASLITFLIGNALFLYLKGFAFSRLVLIYFCLFFLVLATGWRLVHFLIMDSTWGRKKFSRKALIVGLGEDADFIYRRITGKQRLSYEVIGFVGELKGNSAVSPGRHLLGPTGKLGELIRQYAVDEVIITQDDVPVEEWIHLVEIDLDPRPVFRIVPHGVNIFLSQTRPEQLAGFPSIQYLMEPLTAWEKLVKRGFDLLAAAAVLLLVSPILLLFAVLIKLESPGGVFYVQERVGINGRPFRLIKFRSMVENAEEETGPVWAERDDKRVTRIGRYIRRTGLDEFPQLINVIKGEMSLVGPRPERSFFVKQHPELTQWRLSVKPGMTGLAQIHGRYDITLREKVQYDLYYIQNYSMTLDIEILIRTLVMIIKEEFFHFNGQE